MDEQFKRQLNHAFKERMMFFKKKKRIKVPNKNYKKECELTKEDFAMIDLDRRNTGIEHYSDEYYYNNFLYHNYDYQ